MVFDFAADSQSVGEQSTGAAEAEPCGRKADRSARWGRDVEGVRTCDHRLSTQDPFAWIFEIVVLVPVEPSVDETAGRSGDAHWGRQGLRVEPATELNAVFIVGRDRQCIVDHTYGRKLELRIVDRFIDRSGKCRRETVRGDRREVDRDGDVTDSEHRRCGQWVGVDDLEAYGIPKAIGQEHRVSGREACEVRLHEDFVGPGLNSSHSAQCVRQIESMAAGSTE